MKKFERVKAVVSLDAIAHNFAEMKKNIAKGTKIVAVIKADGYGHGAEAIARLIEDYDYIWGFAVATPEEALQLRTFGVKKPILILGIVFEEYFTEMIAKEIRLTVCTYEMAQKLSEEAQRQGRDVHIHIGLDTGMSRIGFADRQESVEEIKKISQLPNLKIEGMFTHFARADEQDLTSAHQQFANYQEFLTLLEEAGFVDSYRKIYPNPLTHPGFTYPSDNPAKTPEKITWAPKADERDRIDFIFYKGEGLDARKAVIFGPKGSIVRAQRVQETSKDKFLLPLDVWPTDHKGLLVTFICK